MCSLVRFGRRLFRRFIKKNVFGNDSCPGQLLSPSLAGDLGPVARVGGSGLVRFVSILIYVIGISYVRAIMCILMVMCAAPPLLVVA